MQPSHCQNRTQQAQTVAERESKVIIYSIAKRALWLFTKANSHLGQTRQGLSSRPTYAAHFAERRRS